MNSYKMWRTVTVFITAELWKDFWSVTQISGELVPKKQYLNSVRPLFIYYLLGFHTEQVVVCGKTSVKGKIVLFKNKRSHNLETLKWIHTKCGALSQISLLLNCGKISSLSPEHWGSSKRYYLNSLKPQFLYFLLGCHKKKVATTFNLYFKKDVLMLHVYQEAHI